MNRSCFFRYAIFAFVCVECVDHAGASTRCVASTDELIAALAAAEQSPESDDIRIRAGLYAAPVDGWHVDKMKAKIP